MRPLTSLPPTPEVVLAVRGLTKRFGEGDLAVTAVAGADLDLYSGELVGLVGPSGSGKSTFLLMAGMLEQPTEGELWLGGRCLTGTAWENAPLQDYRRRHVGFVFQKPNLIAFLTAHENVQVALEINDTPPDFARHHAAELLESFAVAHRADAYPRNLSGGEQQRVAVARALANDPALILADEPTAALDGPRGRQVVELFKRITRERGTAVIMVTHDLRHLDLVDRVVEMADGRLTERDTSLVDAHR